MGTLMYDNSLKAEFDDRLLAHLQIVIGAKLRRKESFHFTWKDAASIGNGRTSIWLDSTIPIVYKFFGSKPPEISRAWVEAMTITANSTGGLHIVPEPTSSGSPQ